METDAAVMDLTVACVTSVKNATGLELDLTQDTLPILDHYLERAQSPAEEIVSLVAPMCGAYFGELLRRHFEDGVWNVGDDYAQWRLSFKPGSLEINPIGLALQIITRSDASGWGAHLQMAPSVRAKVQRALAVLGSVRDDDFYTFAVQFEGIDQAYRALLNNPEGMDPNP